MSTPPPARPRRIRTRTAEGRAVTLRSNDPVPASPEPRPSRLVPTKGLGTAGLRLEIERILDPSCGPDRADRLAALGLEAVPVLAKIAATPDDCPDCPPRRLGAIAALGLFATLEASDALTALVEDEGEDEAVQTAAAVSLGRIGSAGALARLAGMLEGSSSRALRMAAAKGLGWSGSITATSLLQRAAAGDPDPTVRGQAAASLTAISAATGLQLGAIAEVSIPKLRRPTPRRAPAPSRAVTRKGGRAR